MNDFRYKFLYISFLSFLFLISLIIIDEFSFKTIKIVKAAENPVCSIAKGRVELFTIASDTSKAVAIFKQSNNKKFLLSITTSSCSYWSDYNQLDGPKISKNNNSYGFIGRKAGRVTIFFFASSSDTVTSTFSDMMVRNFDLTDNGNDFIAVLVKRNRNKEVYVYNKTKILGPFKKVSKPIFEQDGDSYAFYADGKLFINGEEVNLLSVTGTIQNIDRILFDPYSRGYVVTGIKNDGKSFLLKSSPISASTFDNLSRIDNIYFAPNNQFAFTYLSSTPTKREMYVYINGYTRGPYEKIENFVFSESYTTSSYGFVASKKTDDKTTRYYVNINNKELPVNGFVYGLRLSNDGEKYAFVFNSDSKTLISFGRIADFVNATPTNIHIATVNAGTVSAIPIAVLQESDIPNVYGPFDILFNYNFNPDYLIYVINSRYYVAFLNENKVFGYYNMVLNYPDYLIGLKDDDQYLITPYNDYGPYRTINNVLTAKPTTSDFYLYSSIEDDFKTYVNIITTSSAANSEISFGPYDLVAFLELKNQYVGFIGSNLLQKKSSVGVGKIDNIDNIQENEFFEVSKKIFFSEEGSAFAFLAKATSGSPVSMYVNFSDLRITDFNRQFETIKTIGNIEILKVVKPDPNKIVVNLFDRSKKRFIVYEFAIHYTSSAGIIRTFSETQTGENKNIIALAYNKNNIYFIAKKENGEGYYIYYK